MAKLDQYDPERHVVYDDDPEQFQAPLIQHLEELRNRILKMLVILVVGWIAGWMIQTPVYEYLLHYAKSQVPKSANYSEAFRNLMDGFMLKMKFSFFLGLIVTFPLLVNQLWAFIAPGLKRQERQALKAVAPLSAFLFVLGASLCWMVIPMALRWFASYLEDFPGTALIQDPGTLVFFILKMMLAFGIGFQLPIVVWFLAKVEILTPQALFEHWRHATVVIFFLSMILTPSNDVPSMLMMAIPLTLLFFLSLGAVRFSSRKAPPADVE